MILSAVSKSSSNAAGTAGEAAGDLTAGGWAASRCDPDAHADDIDIDGEGLVVAERGPVLSCDAGGGGTVEVAGAGASSRAGADPLDPWTAPPCASEDDEEDGP